MPTSTYIALATYTSDGTESSLSFGSIPGSYRDLVLVVSGTASTATQIFGRLNSDTGSNYSNVYMRGYSSGTQSASATQSYFQGTHLGSSATQFIMQVMDYSATDKHKTILTRLDRDGATQTFAFAERWASTSAVTSIDLTLNSGTLSSGTTLSLFGIEA